MDKSVTKRSVCILLTLAMLLVILTTVSFAEETDTTSNDTIFYNARTAAESAGVTIDVTDHQASSLESEIEALLSKAGVLDKSMVSTLSVSGGIMDGNDFKYLADNFSHLKSIDLSGT